MPVATCERPRDLGADAGGRAGDDRYRCTCATIRSRDGGRRPARRRRRDERVPPALRWTRARRRSPDVPLLPLATRRPSTVKRTADDPSRAARADSTGASPRAAGGERSSQSTDMPATTCTVAGAVRVFGMIERPAACRCSSPPGSRTTIIRTRVVPVRSGDTLVRQREERRDRSSASIRPDARRGRRRSRASATAGSTPGLRVGRPEDERRPPCGDARRQQLQRRRRHVVHPRAQRRTARRASGRSNRSWPESTDDVVASRRRGSSRRLRRVGSR